MILHHRCHCMLLLYCRVLYSVLTMVLYCIVLFSCFQLHSKSIVLRCTAIDPGINDDQKPLYEWTFECICGFSTRTVLEAPTKGRFAQVKASLLKEMPVEALPDMSLRATAEYFVKRLSPSDFEKLSSRMSALHGHTISVGSTCSGTDVIIPVMKWTFHTLSRLFGVT